MNIERLTITEVYPVKIVYNKANHHVAVVERERCGFSLCESGHLTYTHRGKTVVSHRACAVFHPAGATYSLDCNESGTFYVVNFDASVLPCEELCSFDLFDTEAGLSIVRQMQKNDLLPGMRAENMSLLYRLIAMLCRTPLGDVARQAKEAIEREFGDASLTVGSLAVRYHVSESYLRRLFSSAYGVSPKEYLSSVRIARAKQLFQQGSISVTETAERCGYASVYHFCRAFRLKTGMSAGEYAKHVKTTEI